jgi:hypothetical protein
MATELTKIEIALPDPRRPATMPSLPAWLARSSAAVRPEVQMTPDGKSFEPAEVMVLPREMLPSPEQRRAMADHIANLRSYLAETAENSTEAETSIATSIAALLMVLPSARKSELGAEARADVYLDVLDDVPWWALKAAIRKWHKHDCGVDERGKPYDYHWAPDPGTLRRIAYGETWPIKLRISQIAPVLVAREYVDCSAQLERGRAAMAGLNIALKSGDLDGARTMTFEQAIERATAPANPPRETPADQAAE